MRPFREEVGPYLGILMMQNNAVEASGYRASPLTFCKKVRQEEIADPGTTR